MMNTDDIFDAATEAIGRLHVVQVLVDKDDGSNVSGGWHEAVIQEMIKDITDGLRSAVDAEMKRLEKTRRTQSKGGAR